MDEKDINILLEHLLGRYEGRDSFGRDMYAEFKRVELGKVEYRFGVIGFEANNVFVFDDPSGALIAIDTVKQNGYVKVEADDVPITEGANSNVQSFQDWLRGVK